MPVFTLKVSSGGLDAIMDREGFKTVGYPDSRGIPTNGVGHAATGGPPQVYVGQVWSIQQVKDVLAADIATYEACVNGALTRQPTQNQFDAMVSMTMNIGQSGFVHSSTLRWFNAGDIQRAADCMMLWDIPPEITGRRAGEMAQFLRPDGEPAPSQPVHVTIANVQTMLNVWLTEAKLPLVLVDGILGKQTMAEIEWFQYTHGLTVDGEPGDETIKALEKVTA